MRDVATICTPELVHRSWGLMIADRLFPASVHGGMPKLSIIESPYLCPLFYRGLGKILEGLVPQKTGHGEE